MNRRRKQAYLWHTNHEDYKKRISEARKIIKQCYTNYNNPYVSFSGGKDSTVLVHMVLSEYPDANIWHWDYGDELMPRPFEKECLINLHKMGAKNVIVNKRIGDKFNTKSGYVQFFKQISKNKKEYGWDVSLVGVRQEESLNRKNKYNKYFMDESCFPIRKLTVEDVWGYILEHDLPYHSTYNLYGDYVGWDNVRFVTFFDPEFEQLDYHENIFLPEFRD